MSLEQWNIVTSIATLLVLTTAAIVAFVQLRHIRLNNEFGTFSEVFELWYQPPIQEGVRFIQNELARKMEDPEFRRELDAAGPVDHLKHPEINVCDFFDFFGVYVMLGKMREEMIMHAGSQLIESLWQTLSPTIAIMRRKRGAQLYISFEYLAHRARLWSARYPNGYQPKGWERLPNPDVWRNDVRAS